MNRFENNKTLSILLTIQGIAYVIVLNTFNGTGDSGDSIMHYLYAKHSFQHSELFFNHWAKPLYVLLASPFAQFGIIGIKVFNACMMMLCSIFTFKTIQTLRIENPMIGALILVCSPLTFVLTFSGLTEPLFATLLAYSIYQIASNRMLVGCMAASFLPFVRSEGLIILGVLVAFLLLKKETKRLAWLMTGSVIYSLAGGLVYGNVLWIFTEIPYAQLSSPYNTLYANDGRLYHFFIQMNYVVGVPIYVLFWVGALSFVRQLKKSFFDYHVSILVFASFAAFFIAHTLFWYLGIFNSMGLKRVLISVAPLISIIALTGYNRILALFARESVFKKITSLGMIGIMVIFPFTSNPAAIHWKSDLNLSADQRLSQEIASFILEHSLSDRRMFFLHPYLSESLSIDWFDTSKRMNLNMSAMQEIRTGDIVIWDNWFSVVEGGISDDYLRNNPSFEHKLELSAYDNREITYSIYVYK